MVDQPTTNAAVAAALSTRPVTVSILLGALGLITSAVFQPLGGDLSGTMPNPVVAQIAGNPCNASGCALPGPTSAPAFYAGTTGSAAQQTIIGYNTSSDYGTIQAAHQGAGYTPLQLNPGGGAVDVGPGAFMQGSILSFNPAANNSTTGNAVFQFTPTISSTYNNGLFVYPTIGTMNNNQLFTAAYNMKWGNTGSGNSSSNYVPQGTQSNLSGYECNILTNQQASDAAESNHCFGATMIASNGVFNRLGSLTGTINNVAANFYGLDVSLFNNVAGGEQDLAFFESDGTSPTSAAVRINDNLGVFTHGIRMGGNDIVELTKIGFAQPGSTASPNTPVPTPYTIDGSQTDTLRISGGGSAGGMIFYGSTAAGADGLFRFRNNSVNNTQGASIDGGTGNAAFGNLLASGHIAGNGPAPTLSASAGTPTLSAGANDNHGTITNGSTAGATVTLTFAAARTNVPDCIVQTVVTNSAITRSAPTTTGFQVVFSAANGQATYMCMGQ